MTKTMPCPACQLSASDTPLALATCGDIGLAFLRCPDCTALRLPPQQQQRHNVESDLPGPVSPLMTLLFRWRLHWLCRHHPPLRNREAAILDVGCGDGQFLAFLHSQGYHHLHGVEPETARRDNARSRGLAVAPSLDDLPLDRFDIICLWHVLEHVEQPLRLLHQLRERLTPQGALLISIPNHGGWQTRLFGLYSSFLDYGRHLWYWDRHLAETLPNQWPVRLLPGRNLEYELFGWVDSLAGFLSRSVNLVHRHLKKNRSTPVARLGVLLLAAGLLPLALLLTLLAPPSRGATLTFTIE
ncbi:MAG: class I SAM-dependent methyltransferase [Magnetococcales bacterium]|nr:class I SAM-dependent methyltransferase [Magnetococcales bacterium]